MSQANRAKLDDEMQADYDIRGGVRGKYLERYRAGTNVVLLDQDVATVFRDSESVNRALRLLVDLARKTGVSDPPTAPLPPHPTKPALAG